MSTHDVDSRFQPIQARMQAEGLPDIFIHIFRHYYEQLVQGFTGLIPEKEICPVDHLPDSDALSEAYAQAGLDALSRTVMIKLNGGLGTTMGLDQAKSLLVVKEGLTFLDITARQALHVGAPLILMDSFVTRDDTLAFLKRYPDLWRFDIGVDFLQHKAPRVCQSDFSMVSWPQDPDLEWSPAGHGDLYAAMVTSGTLAKLLAAGFEYAFVSNVDNLGASIDERILGYFASRELPFMMEVTDRTEADRKGGHLAQRLDGQLILRELAQTPPEDHPAFQDITRYRYFNTNNLWVNLRTLDRLMRERQNILGLPLIRNPKVVDPRDPSSPPIYQLEIAMGSAIAVFEGAQAIRVPRARFAPVKSTDDLLVVRSDAFVLTDDYRVAPHVDRRKRLPVARLDPRSYRFIDQLEARFPEGAPSMLACDHLVVEGNVVFGRDVVLRGDVRIKAADSNPAHIPDGTFIEGEYLAR